MPNKSVAGTPADKTVRYTPLSLYGEEYSLVYDFNAIAVAEQVAKVNLLEALDFRDMTAGQFRGLFYAALLKAQPKMRLSEVGDLISLEHMPRITEALLETWRASIIPSTSEEASENPQQPEPSPAD